MKHFIHCKVWVLAGLLLFASSCSKEKQAGISLISDKPVAIQTKDNFAHFTYNASGRLQQMGMYENDGRALSSYAFQYEGEKLSAIVNGKTIWNYVYAAGKLERIHITNIAGQHIATYKLTYKGAKLVEQVNYLYTDNGKQVPSARIAHQYSEAGNVLTTTHYTREAGKWIKTGATRILAYDQQKNVLELLENYPFVPGQFSTNNPLMEERTNEWGEVVETLHFNYTYDPHGRTLSRTTTHSSAWFPETITYTKIHY